MSRYVYATLSVIPVLSAVLGCAASGPDERAAARVPPKQVSRSGPQAVEAVGAYLNPDLFDASQVQTDVSGRFIRIDDMRFRVNNRLTSAHSGLRWGNGSFNYDLAPDVRADSFESSQFRAACDAITATSGIKCFDVNQHPIGPQNHVYVVNGTGNSSYVGRIGGRQALEIHDWISQIVVAHEIKHALGWAHEHQRDDRDSYVSIHWNNIQPGETHNFDIIVPSAVAGNYPYNFDSIMHYGPAAFSNNGAHTIDPLPAYQSHLGEMGQLSHISPMDITQVIGIYGDKDVEWCGQIRKPRYPPPPGCFFECQWAADPSYGKWLTCGNCPGAEICP